MSSGDEPYGGRPEQGGDPQGPAGGGRGPGGYGPPPGPGPAPGQGPAWGGQGPGGYGPPPADGAAWGQPGALWQTPGYADAPTPGPVPVRPMGLGELLDAAFKLLRADFGQLLLAVGVVVIPTQILLTALGASLSTDLFATLEANPEAIDTVLEDAAVVLPGFVLVGVLSAVLLLLAAGAVIRIGAARYLGGSERAADALRTVGRRALPLIGSRLLVALIILAVLVVPLIVGIVGLAAGIDALAVVGFVALVPAVLLAIYLYIALFLAVPPVLLEGAGAVASLRRSRQLVRGRWWPVFGIVLVANIVIGFVGIAVGGLFTGLGGAFPTEWYGWVLTAIGAILTSLVTEPVIALVTLLLYADARVRKEGLDLQLRAGAASPAPGPFDTPGGAAPWSPEPSPG